jgi:hypothetical protein
LFTAFLSAIITHENILIMKNKILSVCLFTFVSFFFFSCEKEYSCEGCGGVLITNAAAFSFTSISTGSSNNCSGAVVNGDFVAGTASTTGNTVILNVLVDSAGSYAVSTNSLNGISFSAAGFFTTPGTHTITLRATGTPTTAGNFNYTVGGSGGCGFTVTVVPVVDNNFVYYYEGNIDGVFYKETVTTTNGYEAGYIVSGTNEAILYSTILPASFPPMPTGKTGMEVSKGILYNYPTRNNTEFKTFFNLGNYSYTNNPSNNDGVNITWYDKNGTEWKTDNAPADQAGSRFAIVLVEEAATTPIYTVAITFTFDCKLYDASGNVKTLTGGKYKGVFGKL